ncbi:MAG: glycine zipper domain-containing protein [bacterium]
MKRHAICIVVAGLSMVLTAQAGPNDAAAGALVGAAVGSMGHHANSESVIGGAVVGAILGAIIGQDRDVDRREYVEVQVRQPVVVCPEPEYVWVPGVWVLCGRERVWYSAHWEAIPRRVVYQVPEGWNRDREERLRAHPDWR